MTLANRITFARLAMTPVFATLLFMYSPEREWMRPVGLSVYVVAALSDMLDGWIARRFNQRSELGARLDPMADKLMVNLGFIFVASNPHFDPGIPLWFPVIVLVRDLILVLGATLITEYIGAFSVHPHIIGKLTTAFHMAALIGVLLALPFMHYFLLVTVVVTVLSLLDYIVSAAWAVHRHKAA